MPGQVFKMRYPGVSEGEHDEDISWSLLLNKPLATVNFPAQLLQLMQFQGYMFLNVGTLIVSYHLIRSSWLKHDTSD